MKTSKKSDRNKEVTIERFLALENLRLGQIVNFYDCDYEIVGYNDRNSKRPIELKNVKTGKIAICSTNFAQKNF